MDHHQGLTVQLVEMIMVIEIKVFGKANVHVLCIHMSRSKGLKVISNRLGNLYF